MLRLGFGRVNTTPELGLRVAGTPPGPRAEAVEGPLQGRILLADDGIHRVAIVFVDLMTLIAPEVTILRNRLAAVGDLEPEAILVACSHTHTSPFTFVTSDADEFVVYGYLDDLYGRLETAMAAAVDDLRPVELVASRIQAPGWAFNRRPIYAGDEVATHGPTWGEGFVRMEDEPDEELQVLLAREPGGAVVGGLVSFACHPTVMMKEPVYSSDYPGALTDELAERHGGTFGFLLGASGDTSNPDPASHDLDAHFGRAHKDAMGRALADRAAEALTQGRSIDASPIAFASTRLRIPQRRPTAEQVEIARGYLEDSPDDIDEQAVTRRLYGHDYTFYDAPPRANERHARELLGMWEWQRRVGTREMVDDVEIQVLTLGDVAVVAFPVELFTTLGRRLKSQSPIANTFIATLANGWHGYVPTEEAFSRGGYEPFLSYQSRLIPEAGALMSDAALELLRQLARSR